jgi:chaperonin cofactor prefoldin
MDNIVALDEVRKKVKELEAQADIQTPRLQKVASELASMPSSSADPRVDVMQPVSQHAAVDITEYRLEQHEKRLEAQDAKMDRIEAAIGELRVSLARVEAGVSGLRATVILTGIGAVALVVGVLAYGQTWFGIGVSTRDIVRATVAEMRQDVEPPKP